MKKKPVFIHVPKTAGSSILHSFDWFYYAGHATYEEAVEMFGADCFYFAVVRHPVDRFISCMAVVYQNIDNYPYIMGCLEGDVDENSSFADFLRAIVNWLPDLNFKNHVRKPQKVLFRSQSEQLKGLPCVIYYDDLYYDLEKIYWRFVDKRLMIGPIKNLGQTTIPKPRLGKDTIALIEEYYKQDMHRFGFASRK